MAMCTKGAEAVQYFANTHVQKHEKQGLTEKSIWPKPKFAEY